MGRRKSAVRRTLALAAAGLLAAVLPAGLVVAQAPPAASLGGHPAGPASTGPGVDGTASPAASSPVGGRAHASRARLRHPANTFRTVHLASGRRYTVHLPPPQLAQARLPLVVVLHGLHHSWQQAERSGGWARYADANGFLVAYGIGIGASWNAGGCCGAARHNGIDDVGYLVDLVTDLAHRYPIDRTRVYVAGFSDGDMMAIRVACDRPDVFAAAGGAAGALASRCWAPAWQIRVLHLHGRYDTVVPYRGGYSGYTRTWFPAATALPRLLATGSADPVVSVVTLNCTHLWPKRSNACRADGTDLIWRWMSQFHRPPPRVAPQLP
jgi:polyhydroxybutyrate depolymerase